MQAGCLSAAPWLVCAELGFKTKDVSLQAIRTWHFAVDSDCGKLVFVPHLQRTGGCARPQRWDTRICINSNDRHCPSCHTVHSDCLPLPLLPHRTPGSRVSSVSHCSSLLAKKAWLVGMRPLVTAGAYVTSVLSCNLELLGSTQNLLSFCCFLSRLWSASG